MQPFLRKAATASIRTRPRSALAIAGLEAHNIRPLTIQVSTKARAAAKSPKLCRNRWHARSFSSAPIIRFEYKDVPSKRDTGSEEKVKETKVLKKSEPLRVLFCGSDEFSCAALEALYQEHKTNPELIESIDVVTRPGKFVGRGNKNLVHPPIRDRAQSLGLPIHERDTFTGWNMPPNINIIIAVSFGLFVPPRLLNQALYGGLNIHPSLLPDLRGPAPLHHALLAERQSTGVSLQTLDLKHFDRGKILAQTPAQRIPESCDYQTLHDILTPLAADLLIRGLRDGVHIPPLKEVKQVKGADTEQAVITPLHAPKITKADCQILPHHIPQLLLRYRVLGPLWMWTRDPATNTRTRLILSDISLADPALKPPVPPKNSKTPAPAPTPEMYRRSLALEYDVSKPSDENTVSGEGEGEPRTRTEWLDVDIPMKLRDDEAVYIRPYRIGLVKAEGAAAKPAPRVLKKYLLEGGGETADTPS
ncbi:Formyltransferase [Annulohypoxylon nitens]|nr:Formyltransferase [Annulohypoxylon nitens]